MARGPSKTFGCSVIEGTVTIVLQRRPAPSPGRPLFVRCSERDCQYVDVNAPPCPLTLALFSSDEAALPLKPVQGQG